MYRFYDSRSKEIIILGDTNCDDLPVEDKNTVIKNLRAFYREYQIEQLIRKSTSVTNCSDTLVDHFATNTLKFIIKSGFKTIGFSDHDLIYGMRKITAVTRKEPKLIKYRSLKHYDPKKFRADLMNTDWTRMLGLKDIHQCSREWERKFVDLLNKHAPFKHRNVRNTCAPYIDHELRQKMFRRDLFKKKHSKYKDPNDWTQYKTIKNENQCGTQK